MPVITPFSQLPTPQQVAALAGFPAGVSEVESVPLVDWFSRFFATPYTDMDKAQARQVADEFYLRYSQVAAYRVHDTNNPAVWQTFLLGLNKCGVSGLKTYSVET